MTMPERFAGGPPQMMREQIVAGSSLSFLTAVADYPASDGWTLKFRLVPRTAGNQPIELTATAEGDDYRIAVAATVTATWAPDWYGWAAWVEKAGEVYDLAESGQTEVRPNPRTVAAGTDLRSQARKALEDLRAALAAWSPLHKRYQIAGREMEFNTTGEIIKLMSYWQQQVDAEDRLAGRGEQVTRFIRTVL